jgi:hypothetical protein
MEQAIALSRFGVFHLSLLWLFNISATGSYHSIARVFSRATQFSVHARRAQLVELEEERDNFEDTWKEKCDKKHENFVMLFINKRTRQVDPAALAQCTSSHRPSTARVRPSAPPLHSVRQSAGPAPCASGRTRRPGTVHVSPHRARQAEPAVTAECPSVRRPGTTSVRPKPTPRHSAR